MSKSYKKKTEKKEDEIEKVTLSKKEQYDLNKKKKQEEKEKLQKKQSKKAKNKKEKQHQTNLGARIFAIIMLLLMLGSVIASVASYATK